MSLFDKEDLKAEMIIQNLIQANTTCKCAEPVPEHEIQHVKCVEPLSEHEILHVKCGKRERNMRYYM
jgi:hypothetical protein